MPTLALDWRLRLAAFDALRVLRGAAGGVVRLADLENGFVFEGERVPLINARRGIWRPRQLGRDGAALSVVTTPPKRGKVPPYDDQVGSDDGWFVYREGDDPALWTNRAVRRAMERRRPLVYLYGLQAGLYDPIFPCYVAQSRVIWPSTSRPTSRRHGPSCRTRTSWGARRGGRTPRRA